MTTPTCATCRFFQECAGDEDRGWCHRYPPVFFGEPSTEARHNLYWTDFPPVESECWCGEHQPKQKQKARRKA